MSQEIATASEMIESAREYGALKEVRREALCIVVVLKSGTEFIYRADNEMFLSKKLKSQRQS